MIFLSWIYFTVASMISAQIAIVSYQSENVVNEGYAVGRKNIMAYALMHGYDYLVFNETTVPHIGNETRKVLSSFGFFRHHWTKPHLLKFVIEEKKYDWIAYFDSDIIITNMTRKLDHYLGDQKHDLVIADDVAGICNGVFFVKRNVWSKNFMNLWWGER